MVRKIHYIALFSVWIKDNIIDSFNIVIFFHMVNKKENESNILVYLMF